MTNPPATQAFSVDTLTVEQVAKTLDQSLLRPELTQQEVRAGCELALRYHVASVCVRPCDVRVAAGILTGSDVQVGTVIGFPHGTTTTVTKVYESRTAMNEGAVELDMVLNISWLRSGLDDAVRDDIHAVVEAAADRAIVKVILENAYLTDEQKVRGCQLAEAAGADYVKTSTGYAPTGATVEDLRLMRRSVSPHVKVKAAGGIRTLDQLIAALNAGADRIGATATEKILEELKARKVAASH